VAIQNETNYFHVGTTTTEHRGRCDFPYFHTERNKLYLNIIVNLWGGVRLSPLGTPSSDVDGR
jgi:hypothetical protein